MIVSSEANAVFGIAKFRLAAALSIQHLQFRKRLIRISLLESLTYIDLGGRL